jgi:2',3'-cyclic-nucleotide 2'-phosphodiesterase (5'-nucleotidase family)/enterochelin esterase-like enzyme
MKSFIKRLIVYMFIVIVTCGVSIAQPDTLTIIHVNDTHSNLDAYGTGKYGGIARAASVIGYWKMTEPNPILVHAGDLLVGNLMFNTYFGVPELKILDQLGFDALVLGNHEFDVGPVSLAGIIAEADLSPEFYILGTNVKNLDQVPELEPFVHSSAMKEFGGIKVGFIGLTTPAANLQSNPQPLYIDDNLVQIAMEEMMVLRGAGADVVIVVSHLGIALDMLIAQYLTGIDAIIGGHSHTPLHDVIYVNGIPIIHAGEFYSCVGKLRLIFDGSVTQVLDYTTQHINDAIPADPTLEGMVEYLKAGVIEKFADVLGNPYEQIATAVRFMHCEPTSFDTLDTPMGNLVTAAMRAYEEGIDCALEPTGHIVAGGIFEGPVTAAELFRIYPYGYEETDGLGFRLATYYLYGLHIYGMLHELLNYIHPEIGDYEYVVQSAGLDYVVYNRPSGYEIGEIYINGAPLNPMEVYKVASSDMVVNYMKMMFDLEPPGLQIHDVSVFQIVKEYAEAIGELDLLATGHNRVVDFPFDPDPGPLFKEFFLQIQSEPAENRAELVDSFLTAVPAFPFVESDTIACFLYRGNVSGVTVPGDMNGWDMTAYPMDRLSRTDLWYRVAIFEPDARLDYKFVLNGNNWILDPRNPRQVTGGFGPNSELAMPGYVDPPEILYYPDIAHGTLHDTTFTSTILGNARTIRVYTPPSYADAVSDSFAVVVFHDGLEYITLANAKNVLDYLIHHKKIPPVIGVFVPPVNRNPEYIGEQINQFASFIVNELMVYIDSRYRTKDDPKHRAVVGISNGGNISLWISFSYPEVFGKAASFSGNIQQDVMTAFNASETLPLRFYLDAGTYESPILWATQTFYDIVSEKQYPVEYRIWHEGHSWGSWRAHLDNALAFLFEDIPVGIAKQRELPASFALYQNFPNPFNPSTTIRYALPGDMQVKLEVYNVLGQCIKVLVDEMQRAGYYDVAFDATSLSSGIYLYRIEAGGLTEVRKLTVLK